MLRLLLFRKNCFLRFIDSIMKLLLFLFFVEVAEVVVDVVVVADVEVVVDDVDVVVV